MMVVLSPTYPCLPCARHHTIDTPTHIKHTCTQTEINNRKMPRGKCNLFCMHMFEIKIIILWLFFYVVEGVLCVWLCHKIQNYYKERFCIVRGAFLHLCPIFVSLEKSLRHFDILYPFSERSSVISYDEYFYLHKAECLWREKCGSFKQTPKRCLFLKYIDKAYILLDMEVKFSN